MHHCIVAGMLIFFIVPVWDDSFSHVSAQDTHEEPSEKPPAEYGYHVERILPHDATAFTQGLVYHDGVFYESTGLYGASSLRKIDITSGEITRRLQLPPDRYGEGLALANDTFIQLTWLSRKGFVYDEETFTLLREFSYEGEGWGITYDGKRLIMSDGSASLSLWDVNSLEPIGKLPVTDRGKPVFLLNELEFVKGDIYANVWKTEKIAIISPQTGVVKGWINLHGLYRSTEENQAENVLNGIAYDEKNDRLFVTGKRWPHVYEIKLVTAQ